MQYCYMDKDDRLVAVVERIGNGRPTSPVRWLLRWAIHLGREDSVYGDRWEAVATIWRTCPEAALKVFNQRGQRVR
jgi:hypothetical protein